MWGGRPRPPVVWPQDETGSRKTYSLSHIVSFRNSAQVFDVLTIIQYSTGTKLLASVVSTQARSQTRTRRDWRLCCGDGFVSLLSPNCPSMARDHFDWNRRGMANSALGGKGIVCGSREGLIIGSQIAARSSIPLLKPNLPHRPQQLLHIRRLVQRIHLRPNQYSVLIDDERRPLANSRNRRALA